MAASRTLHLCVDRDTCKRLAARAASDSLSMQNVVLDACRTLVNEPLRGRPGTGGRPETRRGGPANLGDIAGWPDAPILELKIGGTTFVALERESHDGRSVDTVIRSAIAQWLRRDATPDVLSPNIPAN